jgi:uncharacterized protein YndB with AHSA1/START domain
MVFRRLLAGVITTLILVVLAGFLLPSEVTVEREIIIAAPPAQVFELVNNLQHWADWEPWGERDPTIEYSYGDIRVGVGGIQRWTSSNSGDGVLKITASTAPSRIEMDMSFNSGQYEAVGIFLFTPVDGGTRVVWRDEMDMGAGPVARWFGLFMDGMVGPDFETGLANLKAVAEESD